MSPTHKYRPQNSKSRIKGECEQGFFKKLRYRWGQYFDAVDAFQKKYKEPGQRYGPLGPYGREVYKVLVKRTGRNGQLDLSLETIARLAGCCKSAAVTALKLLRDNGFVRWINRFVRVEDGPTWGPQVHQTTNAYCVELPPQAAALAPPAADNTPADESARRADMVAQLKTYDAQENGVMDAIDRLGAAIWARGAPDL